MARKSSTAGGAAARFNGFVLAGGQSRRMGTDKARLIWHDQTLLDRSVQLLSMVYDQVRVIGREENPDRTPGLGPLGGIRTALEITDTDWNAIVGVDLPLLSVDFLKFLRNRALRSKHKLIACSVDEKYPLCLAVRSALLTTIANHVDHGKLALRELIETADTDIVSTSEIGALGFPTSLFRNINTPEDWEYFLGK